jgi:FkbM family methyltransferase
MSQFHLDQGLKNRILQNLDTHLIVGAMDGISHDEYFTWVAEKQNRRDTKVVFVEPIKEYVERLKENSLKLDIPVDNLYFEQCCISDKEETVDFAYFTFSSPVGTKPWYIDGCSSVVENGEPLNTHLATDVDRRDLIITQMQCTTVPFLLSKNGFSEIDYLQIDTEGYDQRIVSSLDLEALGVKYLRFEKHYCTNSFLEEILEKSYALGYSSYIDWDVHLVKTHLIN